MNMISTAPIWVLQTSPINRTRLRKTLEVLATPRFFENFKDLEIAIAAGPQPALAIIDIAIPEADVLKLKARIQHYLFPVIIFSTEQSRSVILEMLEAGARDYFLKSTPATLFQAKVEYLLGAKRGEKLGKLELMVTPRLFLVTTKCGAKVKLTYTEFQVFMVLYDAHPAGVKREKIDESIWTETKVIRKTLDVHIFKLRKKLEPLALGVQFCDDRRYKLKKNDQ